MAVREVVKVPDARLRQRASERERFDPALRALAKEMLETMSVERGVGLAGPQIGVMERIFVMQVREDDERVPTDHPLRGKALVLVNPELLEGSEEREEGIEGCLSIPDLVGLVPRHRRVVMRARNEWGKPCRYEVEGFLARIMQHELDHLDGILFPDRVTGEDKLFRVEPQSASDEQPSELEVSEAARSEPG